MEISPLTLAGFGGGLLLCVAIVAGVSLQVRLLLTSSEADQAAGGESKGVGGWRFSLIVFLLVVKTCGLGLGVWLLLFRLSLPLPAFAAGLFFGLAATVLIAVLLVRRRSVKNLKKH